MVTTVRRMTWASLSGAAAIAVADQASKAVVVRSVPHPSRIWDGALGYVEIDLAHNSGGAFSLFADYGTALTVVTGVVIVAILAVLISERVPHPLASVGLTAIVGGALGNFIDRVRLGYVVDFIEIGASSTLRWPTFNVADASIVAGTGLLVFYLLRSEVQA